MEVRLGLIDTLSSGFKVVQRRPWLILPPVLLDLWLWLGPRWSIQPLADSLLRLLSPDNLPAEMAQMVEAAEAGDYAAARAMHHRLLPLLLVNFVESNPGPVKFAMAAMGLCEEVFRLPMVSPRPAAKDRILAVMAELGLNTKGQAS